MILSDQNVSYPGKTAGLTGRTIIACEQALLFGRVKRVSRERTSERRSGSRVLARLAWLAQIGELACRLAR